MKPSIGILMRALTLGGAEKQSLLQAKLMASDYNVYYFVQKAQPKLKCHLDFIKEENINYIQLSGNFFSRARQLIFYCRKYDIKVLFAFLTTDNVLAAIMSIFLKIKYVGGIRNCYLPYYKFVITKLLHKFFLDYVIFNNYSGKEEFVKKGFSEKKSIVIHNCIDKIQNPIDRAGKDVVKILSVGRFTDQKDYYTSFQAISLLVSKMPDKKIHFTIVGGGELEEQLFAWIKEFNLSNVLIVRTPNNLNDYYYESDIYFLSSTFEGIPNTVMEALNFSLPVVATNVGDVKYLVKDGVNGFLTDVRDYKRMADKLMELAVDRDMRILFGKNGNQLLQQNFSEQKFKDEYIKFTQSIV